MSYLDDPDHDWSLDPASVDNSLLEDVIHLAENATSEEVELVLRGYRGLKQRYPDATDQECFGTAMIWLYG